MAGGAAVRSAENVSRGRGAALDLVYGVLVVLQEVRIVIVRLRGAGRIFQGSDGRLCVLPPSHTTCRSYGKASEPLEWFPWITSNISEMRVRLNTSDNLRACVSICQVSHVPFFTHVTVTRLSSLAMAPLSCTARLHNPPRDPGSWMVCHSSCFKVPTSPSQTSSSLASALAQLARQKTPILRAPCMFRRSGLQCCLGQVKTVHHVKNAVKLLIIQRIHANCI